MPGGWRGGRVGYVVVVGVIGRRDNGAVAAGHGAKRPVRLGDRNRIPVVSILHIDRVAVDIAREIHAITSDDAAVKEPLLLMPVLGVFGRVEHTWSLAAAVRVVVQA